MSIQVALEQPIINKNPIQAKKPNKIVSLDYAELRNLTTSQKIPKLLPGLGKRGQQVSFKRMEVRNQLIEQPRLLTTAKERIKQIHEQSAHSQTELSNNLGLSSFLNSRQPTPNNPLNPGFQKKKNPHQRNKLNSINSQLFDIASNPESQVDKTFKFKNSQFRLFDTILGQSQVVYKYVFSKDRTVNPKLIHLWKDCLNHEDKSEIYLPVASQRVEIPYSHARIYPLNEIQHEFKSIFGTGKNRALTVGEEAIIIESIQKYLALCLRQPLKIGRKDFDILQNVLSDCKLNDLEQFPMCMKQAETHFKLLATKWKYSGKLNLADKMLETALLMGKNNFLDLSRTNVLTAYLLQHSNINDI